MPSAEDVDPGVAAAEPARLEEYEREGDRSEPVDPRCSKLWREAARHPECCDPGFPVPTIDRRLAEECPYDWRQHRKGGRGDRPEEVQTEAGLLLWEATGLLVEDDTYTRIVYELDAIRRRCARLDPIEASPCPRNYDVHQTDIGLFIDGPVHTYVFYLASGCPPTTARCSSVTDVLEAHPDGSIVALGTIAEGNISGVGPIGGAGELTNRPGIEQCLEQILGGIPYYPQPLSGESLEEHLCTDEIRGCVEEPFRARWNETKDSDHPLYGVSYEVTMEVTPEGRVRDVQFETWRVSLEEAQRCLSDRLLATQLPSFPSGSAKSAWIRYTARMKWDRSQQERSFRFECETRHARFLNDEE